jgi:hypothetical protein
VLLVGLPPLSLAAFETTMREVADVRSVAFPGPQFDLAADSGDYDLVVVDVTYLDRAVVRPLISRRFRGRATVAYLTKEGGALLDDPHTGGTALLPDPVVPRLVSMAAGTATAEGLDR